MTKLLVTQSCAFHKGISTQSSELHLGDNSSITIVYLVPDAEVGVRNTHRQKFGQTCST